ncbi:MAG TPA: hypothetical protein VJU16_07985, partial [Planctomycetota bacterium]|nr:hypothetical protein [Planctomycetota bacterium]
DRRVHHELPQAPRVRSASAQEGQVVVRSWIVALFLLASCGESAPPPPPTSPPAPKVSPKFGSIEGWVRVDSNDIAPITGSVVGFEKYCGQGPLELGIYLVDSATKGLSGAYVEADGVSLAFQTESIPVLDQKACLFTPTLLVVPPGTVLFKNSDGMPHNVTIETKLNGRVSEGFPGGEAITKKFPFEEKLAVRCTVHPWMQAGLVITRGTAHAVSDKGGRFRIERVEAGKRRVRAWHLLGDEVSVEVDVPPDGVAQVEIPWKPRANFRAAFGR